MVLIVVVEHGVSGFWSQIVLISVGGSGRRWSGDAAQFRLRRRMNRLRGARLRVRRHVAARGPPAESALAGRTPRELRLPRCRRTPGTQPTAAPREAV